MGYGDSNETESSCIEFLDATLLILSQCTVFLDIEHNIFMMKYIHVHDYAKKINVTAITVPLSNAKLST